MEDDEGSSNKITLMTVHSSKGLEFPYVSVAGMEENIFPSGGFMASENEIEEERRLFYVAMTRAKTFLQISFAATRMRNGKHESNSPSRFVREIDNQYVENPLTAEDVELPGGADSDMFTSSWGRPRPQQGFQSWRYGQSSRAESVRRPVEKRPEQAPPRKLEPIPVRRPQVVPKRTDDADFVPTPILQLKAGQRIEHNRFGYGKILEMTGNATDLKAKISFDDYGEKILILKYAKIRKLDVAD